MFWELSLISSIIFFEKQDLVLLSIYFILFLFYHQHQHTLTIWIIGFTNFCFSLFLWIFFICCCCWKMDSRDSGNKKYGRINLDSVLSLAIIIILISILTKTINFISFGPKLERKIRIRFFLFGNRNQNLKNTNNKFDARFFFLWLRFHTLDQPSKPTKSVKPNRNYLAFWFD